MEESGLKALDSGIAESSKSPMTRRIIYERLHSLLQHLLFIVPTIPPIIQPILIRHFPHKRQDKISHVTYIRNLLRVSQYCPALEDRILSTVIDRAIQIDVSAIFLQSVVPSDIHTGRNPSGV